REWEVGDVEKVVDHLSGPGTPVSGSAARGRKLNRIPFGKVDDVDEWRLGREPHDAVTFDQPGGHGTVRSRRDRSTVAERGDRHAAAVRRKRPTVIWALQAAVY